MNLDPIQVDKFFRLFLTVFINSFRLSILGSFNIVGETKLFPHKLSFKEKIPR